MSRDVHSCTHYTFLCKDDIVNWQHFTNLDTESEQTRTENETSVVLTD